MKFLIPLIALVAVAGAYPGLGFDAVSGNTDSTLAQVNPDIDVLNQTGGGNCGQGNGGSSGNHGSGGNGGYGGNGGSGSCRRGSGSSGNDKDGGLLGKGGLLDDVDVPILSDNDNSKVLDVGPEVGLLNKSGCC